METTLDSPSIGYGMASTNPLSAFGHAMQMQAADMNFLQHASLYVNAGANKFKGCCQSATSTAVTV
jgi:hypothetical protein